MNHKRYLVLFSVALLGIQVSAQLFDEVIEYDINGTTAEGRFVFDPISDTPAMGIIIFHQWGGAGDYELARARMLASLGYAVFVADMYGQGVRPETMEARREATSRFYADRALTRQRAAAALDVLRARDEVDPKRIAVMGYCFGGMVALELARSGADIAGAVSIHGNLHTPNASDAKSISSRILVQHGAIDPLVPEEEVKAFREEMAAGDVEYTFIAYEDAVHSFTDWNAGDDPSRGAAYNVDADKQSWEDLLEFLNDLKR